MTRERVRLVAMLAVILLGGVALGIGALGEWEPAAVTRVLVGCVVAVLLLADVRPPTAGGSAGAVNALGKALLVAGSSEVAGSLGEVFA